MDFSYQASEYREYAPEFDVSAEDPEYSSENGVLFNKSKTILLRFPTTARVREYRLPEGVEEIAPYAFARCKVERVALNRVCRVRAKAFYNCEELREVDLGTGMTVLTRDMFFGCFGLKKLEIPENVKEIRNLFAELCTNLQELTIPETVKRMGTMPLGGGNTILRFQYNQAVIHFRDQTLVPGRDGGLVDLERYDREFQDTSSAGQSRNPYRSLTAFLRLTNPVDLKEPYREMYIHFLRRYLFDFAEQIFSMNKVEWMRQLLVLGVVEEFHVERLIQRSTQAGTTAITALLLDFKRKNEPEEDEFAL